MPETEAGLDVVNVGFMDGVRRHLFVKFNQTDTNEGPFWDVWERPEMSKEDQAQVNELLGDGNATVTVGMDMKTSGDYGNAAGCTVYVKLTCNQDDDSLDRANEIATDLAAKFMDEGHAKACKLLNSARGLPDPSDKSGSEPRKKVEVVKDYVTASAKAKTPAKKGPIAKKTGSNKGLTAKKPNFRRT